MIINGVDMENEPKWWGFEVEPLLSDPEQNGWAAVTGYCVPEHRAELIEALTGVAAYYWIDGHKDLTFRSEPYPDNPAFTPRDEVEPLTIGWLTWNHYQFTNGRTSWALFDGSDSFAWKVASMTWGPATWNRRRPPQSHDEITNSFSFRFDVPLGAVPFEEQSLGVACSNSGENLPSGAWPGELEERVEITVAAAVPAGNTIIVAASSWDTGFDRAVYDEQGNTWTLDAQHVHNVDEYRILIYRCNVTNALSAGDYIRFGHRSDTLNPQVETAARCVGAYVFDGTLSVATVGTGGNGTTSNPSINTPAGDIVIAGIALGENDPDGLTLDADWTPAVPFTRVDGGGPATMNALAMQYLADAGATTWSGTIDQARTWAAIAVGYMRS